MTNLKDHSLGHCTEFAWGAFRAVIFFGNSHAQLPELTEAFPNLRFASVHQTHSSNILHAPNNTETPADAHWARIADGPPGLALTVRSADCLPVMIFEPESGLYAAIHAGWRGIENEILINACAELKKQGAVLEKASAWIGPHIGASSFEVGADVGRRLEKRFQAVRKFSGEESALLDHPAIDKAYIDLEIIASAQLVSQGIRRTHLQTVAIDTYRTPSHASFRRDRERAGRQLSFIAISV